MEFLFKDVSSIIRPFWRETNGFFLMPLILLGVFFWYVFYLLHMKPFKFPVASFVCGPAPFRKPMGMYHINLPTYLYIHIYCIYHCFYHIRHVACITCIPYTIYIYMFTIFTGRYILKFKGKRWVPLGRYPNHVYHHVPNICIYGLYRAIWRNIQETIGRVLSQGYPHLPFDKWFHCSLSFQFLGVSQWLYHLLTIKHTSRILLYSSPTEQWTKGPNGSLGFSGGWNTAQLCGEYNKTLPVLSMYGIFTYIYHRNQPNVGKHTSPPWMVSVTKNSIHQPLGGYVLKLKTLTST